MNDEDFMRDAIRLSLEGVRSGRGGPFGCVVVRAGQIVARGSNQVTSTCDPTAHAEVVAIREACKALGTFHLPDCTLYTSCSAAAPAITPSASTTISSTSRSRCPSANAASR